MKFDINLFNRPSDHKSSKCGNCHCPNSYVRKACYILDSDQHVKSYSVKTVKYRFFHPQINKFATNFFDLEVEFDTGKQLIQCIPDDFMKEEIMLARIEAMEAKAEELGIPLQIWSETKLFGTNPKYRESLISMIC